MYMKVMWRYSLTFFQISRILWHNLVFLQMLADHNFGFNFPQHVVESDFQSFLIDIPLLSFTFGLFDI